MELDKVFITHAEVRPLFYENAATPADQTTLHRGEAVAEMMLDVFIWVWTHRGGLSNSHAADWENYIIYMFQHSQFLRGYHLRHEAWHRDLTPLLRRAEQAVSP